MDKRGQVTIFIIIAIVVIGALAFFLLFKTDVIPKISVGKETSPVPFLDFCLEDKVKEGIKIISSQGGYISNPLNKSYKFEGENKPIDISYLCYTQNDGLPCVNQEPMLIQHLEDEIKNYISEDVQYCFNELKKSLEKQGYDVNPDDSGYNGFEVDLSEGKVAIDIDAELTLTKTGETSKQEEFKVAISSKFYELVNVVIEIINKEITNCGFTHYDMFLYPEFDINKFPTLDSSIIYTVKHEDSNEEFKFAVRGCVVSQGY